MHWASSWNVEDEDDENDEEMDDENAELFKGKMDTQTDCLKLDLGEL